MQVPFSGGPRVAPTDAVNVRAREPKPTGIEELQHGLGAAGHGIDEVIGTAKRQIEKTENEAKAHAKAAQERFMENRRTAARNKYLDRAITPALHGSQAQRQAQQQVLSPPPMVEADLPKDPWATGDYDEPKVGDYEATPAPEVAVEVDPGTPDIPAGGGE